MKYRNDLTADYVRSVLAYDPISGLFVRKKSPQRNGQWNERFGDKPTGSPTTRGYIEISVSYRNYKAHRLAWLIMTGFWPIAEIDHRNNITSDNSWKNLREADRSKNVWNSKMSSNNSSGIKGVCWDSKNQKWMAQISVNKKNKYLRKFDHIQEAADAYANAARMLHGEFTNLGGRKL